MINDLRFACRQLLKNPGFTAVALLTLALGIGANTAIFSVLDRLLVRPLPVREPRQLAVLAEVFADGRLDYEFNYPLFRDYQRGNSVFSEISATAPLSAGLGVDGATQGHQALLVSGNYFSMLGVNAALGRVFAPNEGVEIDDAPVLVLSHGLWLRRFGGDPKIIGHAATVNGKPFTIIGVAPREFTGTTRGQTPDLFVPFTMYGQLTDERPGGEHPLQTRYFTWHQILGRLKDGVTHAQAQSSMQSLARHIYEVTPVNTDTNVVVLAGAQGFGQDVQEARLPLRLLFGTAALVLLIVCANLANLQLIRATRRAREFAVRLALGATRRRLIRQLLAESLILSSLGGGLGLFVAVWLEGILEKLRPASFSFTVTGGLDARVLWFAFGTSILAGVVFGLAPAWRASRPQLAPELKGNSSDETRGRALPLRNVLVVAQVALSLLVLAGAGLCVRSLKKLQKIDPGFNASQVVLVSLDLSLNNYHDARIGLFYDQLLARARALPGVEAAGLASVTPLSGESPGMSIARVEGYDKADREGLSADINFVSPDFFRALNVPILKGRDFDVTDTANSLKTVVVDDTLAQRYWSGHDPVGQHLYLPGLGGLTEVQVIGVAGRFRNRSLSAKPRNTLFFPNSQRPSGNLTLAVRTGLATSATIASLRETVKSLDSNVPVLSVRTMEQQMNGSLAFQRMAAVLLGTFGLLALLLSALGIYGVLAYSVTRRTREIGIRMALGAQIGNVLLLVMRQGIGLVALGMVLGLTGAFAATRLLKSFLYEVTPLDPLTFTSVSILLVVIALLACWMPARRATRVDPMEALRHE